MLLLRWIKIFQNWAPTLRQGGGLNIKTRNQAKFLCIIKRIENFEVTLHTHLAHPFFMVRILLYLRKLIQETLSEL